MKNGDYILVVAPPDYPGRLYRRKYCYEHYLRFWQERKILPKEDEVIHHLDGNKHNNDINNLVIIGKVEHISFHSRQRTKRMVILKCPVCGKEFIKEKRKTHLIKGGQATYCSRECCYKANSFRLIGSDEFSENVSNNVIKEFFQKRGS